LPFVHEVPGGIGSESLARHGDPSFPAFRLHERQDRVENVLEGRGGSLDRAGPGEGNVFVHDPLEAADLGLDDLQVFARLGNPGRRGDRFLEELRVDVEGRQGILDLVGDPVSASVRDYNISADR
jgi:hypothetical protein